MSAQAFDSDDHDDFNPIQDLMPPSIAAAAESEEIDRIGRKRMRENDPLRRLVEDDDQGEGRGEDAASALVAQGSPTKRQKTSASDK